MIQRIQSIFLALASFFCFGLFGTDAADTDVPQPGSALFADGHFTLFDDPVLLGLFGLAGVLLLADIFLFRNRPLQIKLSWLSVLLIVAGVGYGAFRLMGDSAAELATPEPGLALPVLATVFGVLAARFIKKDEKLVRSADRLR